MPDVPQVSKQSDIEDQDFQNYQDDFDTSQKDNFADNYGDVTPVAQIPATQEELSEGLRETATDETDTPGVEPDIKDDYLNEIEDRDEDGRSPQ